MEFALGRKRVSEWESTLWIPEMLNLLTAYTITPNGGRIGAPMPPALAPGTSSWDPFGRTRRAELSSDSAILDTSFESRLCWTWNSFVRNVFFSNSELRPEDTVHYAAYAKCNEYFWHRRGRLALKDVEGWKTMFRLKTLRTWSDMGQHGTQTFDLGPCQR